MMLTTREAAHRFHLQAQRGLVNEARQRKADLQAAVDNAVRSLNELREAGICRDWLYDTLRGLHDAAVKADHPLNQTIDNAAQEYAWVDLGELDDLLARIST